MPLYAQAQDHLAEVEAELGEVDCAISRLRSLAASSDDPDHAAQLARILVDAGHEDESRRWRRMAAARYDELIASHPEAFADHAAEFWLAAVATRTRRCGWRKGMRKFATLRTRAACWHGPCREGVTLTVQHGYRRTKSNPP